MEPTRDDLKAWLQRALDKTGETPSGLARRAGLATTTLTRFLNDPAAPMLQLRSVAKIAHVAQLPAIGLPVTTPPHGMAESEGVPLGDAGGLAAAIANLIGARNAADPWTLRTHALEDAGYMPGDIVIVDLNATPQPGCAVCAQIYRWNESKADTIFRLYEPPYLVAASRDPALRKPWLVDNNQVVIKGVVTESLRATRPA